MLMACQLTDAAALTSSKENGRHAGSFPVEPWGAAGLSRDGDGTESSATKSRRRPIHWKLTVLQDVHGEEWVGRSPLVLSGEVQLPTCFKSGAAPQNKWGAALLCAPLV